MRLAQVIGGVVALTGGFLVAGTEALQGAPGDALVVSGSVVNVRTQPSTSARIWVRAREGDPAIEIAREGEWVQVELPTHNAEGWIHSSLLTPAPGQPSSMPADAGREGPVVITPPTVDTPTPAMRPDTTASAPAAPEAPDQMSSEAAPTMVATPSEAASGALPVPVGKPGAEETGPVVLTPPTTEAPTPEMPPASTTAAVEPEAPMAATGAPTPGMVAPPAGVSPAALERFRTSVAYLNDRALSAAGIDLFEDVEDLGGGTVQVQVTDAWALMPPSGRDSYLNTLYDRWLAAAGTGGPLDVQIVGPDGQVISERSGP